MCHHVLTPSQYLVFIKLSHSQNFFERIASRCTGCPDQPHSKLEKSKTDIPKVDFNSTTTTIFSETNNPLFVTKNYKFFKINGRGGMGLVVAIVKSPFFIAINPLVRSVFQLAIGLFMAFAVFPVLLDAQRDSRYSKVR